MRWAAGTEQVGAEASAVLQAIAQTTISPELIPAGDGHDGEAPEQDSEATVGPYELQDFFLYYVLRFGYRPSKVAFLADHAWGEVASGPWPDLIPQDARHAYPPPVPAPVLRHQSVQALGDAQRPEGRLRRLAVTALGLAGAVGLDGGGVARRARRIRVAVDHAHRA